MERRNPAKQRATNFPDSPGSITRRQLPKHPLLQAWSAANSGAGGSAGGGNAGRDVNTPGAPFPQRGRSGIVYLQPGARQSLDPPFVLMLRDRLRQGERMREPQRFCLLPAGDVNARNNFITNPAPWLSGRALSEDLPVRVFLGQAQQQHRTKGRARCSPAASHPAADALRGAAKGHGGLRAAGLRGKRPQGPAGHAPLRPALGTVAPGFACEAGCWGETGLGKNGKFEGNIGRKRGEKINA